MSYNHTLNQLLQVGPNGSGKTTQLKIIAGEIESSFGDVVKSSRDLRIAFLRQEFTDEVSG